MGTAAGVGDAEAAGVGEPTELLCEVCVIVTVDDADAECDIDKDDDDDTKSLLGFFFSRYWAFRDTPFLDFTVGT